MHICTGLTIRSDTNTRFRAHVTAIPALNREFVSDRMVNPVVYTYSMYLHQHYLNSILAMTMCGDGHRFPMSQQSVAQVFRHSDAIFSASLSSHHIGPVIGQGFDGTGHRIKTA